MPKSGGLQEGPLRGGVKGNQVKILSDPVTVNGESAFHTPLRQMQRQACLCSLEKADADDDPEPGNLPV